MKNRHFIVYPFLVALYSVLVLAAVNIGEVVWLHVLIRPIATALIVASVAWILGRAISRDVHIRGLVALVLVVWFCWYGYFRNALLSQPLLFPVGRAQYAIPAYLLLLSAVVYVIVRRVSRPVSDLSRYLNVTATVLLLMPTLVVLRGHGPKGKGAAEEGAATPQTFQAKPDRPDVYLLVLDKYTGAHSLAANYAFDNGPFLDSLRRLGFDIPRSPHANYIHTHLALPALLNWRLLDDRPEDLTVSNGALALDYAAIEDNRTWEFLHERGYRFMFFPSAYAATARNRHADLQLPDPSQVTSEFEVAWRRSTLAVPMLRWWCRAFACQRGAQPYAPAPPELIEWKFRQLEQLPDSSGAIFAFAHFTVPHEPYIFHADCTPRELYWPVADSGEYELPVKRAYIEQIQCVNRKVLHFVETVLAKSKTPPIIILQADHGHGRLGWGLTVQPADVPDQAAERIDIFAAYYLPGHPSDVVYDSITPVNVLPRIFNHYFDANIPLQPDATFWSTWEEPFKFTRMR